MKIKYPFFVSAEGKCLSILVDNGENLRALDALSGNLIDQAAFIELGNGITRADFLQVCEMIFDVAEKQYGKEPSSIIQTLGGG